MVLAQLVLFDKRLELKPKPMIENVIITTTLPEEISKIYAHSSSMS